MFEMCPDSDASYNSAAQQTMSVMDLVYGLMIREREVSCLMLLNYTIDDVSEMMLVVPC